MTWGDRYPRVAAYLAGLPGTDEVAGLDAHPSHRAKASLVHALLELTPWPEGVVLPEGLAPIRRLAEDPPPINVWVSEVHHFALALALADAHRLDAGELRDAWRAQSRILAEKPSYSRLFRVLTPRQLLRGVNFQWSAFHRGLGLTLEGRPPDGVELKLDYPTGLVDRCLADAYVGSWQGTAAVSRFPDAEVTLLSHDASSARYLVRWG
jgi:hypothetical protein